MRKQPTIFPRRLPPGKCFDCGQETSNKYHPRCRPCGYARRGVLPEERFNKNVNKTLSCWLWEGCTNKAGYGVLNVHTKQTMAHRFSWSIINGFIPKGMFVCHHCDNPPCVRPDHLFLGTQDDNIHDMIAKGRARGRWSAPLRSH